MDCVEDEINKNLLGRIMVDSIIREVVMQRQAMRDQLNQPDQKSETDPDIPNVDLEIPVSID